MVDPLDQAFNFFYFQATVTRDPGTKPKEPIAGILDVGGVCKRLRAPVDNGSDDVENLLVVIAV